MWQWGGGIEAALLWCWWCEWQLLDWWRWDAAAVASRPALAVAPNGADQEGLLAAGCVTTEPLPPGTTAVSRRAAPSAGSSASVVSSVASVWLTGTVCSLPSSCKRREQVVIFFRVVGARRLHDAHSRLRRHQTPALQRITLFPPRPTTHSIITVPHRAGKLLLLPYLTLSATTPPASERSIVVSQAPGDLSLAFVGEPIFTRSRRRWWRLSN